MLYRLLLAAPILAHQALAVGTAFGYASGTYLNLLIGYESVFISIDSFLKGTTGGGSAAAAVPTSNAQLVSWLGDSTARVILLESTFDFTGSATSA